MLIWILQKLPAWLKRSLEREIMQRWISGIGGMDWYNAGETDQSQDAQMHGRALAATLDQVLHGR